MNLNWKDFSKVAATNTTDTVASRFSNAIEQAIPFSQKWENFVPDAYWDDIGKVWTVGHGLTQIPDADTGKLRAVRQGDRLTKEQSQKIMERKFRENAYNMYKNIPWVRNLGQDALSAALDTAYNAGWGIFSEGKSPSLNKKMLVPGANPDDVYWSEHDTYTRSGSKSKVPGLVNRRADARKKWGPSK